MNTSPDGQMEASTSGSEVVQVQLFAGMAAEAGQRRLTLKPTTATVAGVRSALTATVPGIGPLLVRSAVAVDGRYAADETPVGPDSEIAIIPPVSGG